MCSCSGSCNCNSTTIPRGPQGTPGQAATITAGSATPLAAGATPTVTNAGNSSAAIFNFGIPAGEQGDIGDPGVNAYTTLTAPFLQPNINSTIVISIANNSWIAIDQIIFIGPTTFVDAGGYYRVIDIPTLTSIEIIRLDWTIPGVTFRSFNTFVGAIGTLVTSAGTIGATGTTSVERIKADAFEANSLSINFTELDADGKIIEFTIIGSTEDGSGVFNSLSFGINDGLTTTTLFYINDENLGIRPASIKYDRNPNSSPSGYASNEYINWISADIKITRISDINARIEGMIYGYNKEVQALFGSSRYVQKMWRLDSGFIYPTDFNIVAAMVENGSGTGISLINILRYNTIS